MSHKLEGKIALVTGGSSGIGLATAQLFAKEGAHVFITGRRKPELDAALKAIGGRATAVQADASKLSDLDRLFADIKREKGRLDIVFANAGILGDLGPIGTVTEENFDRTFATNVKGALFTVQKALALVPDGGSIIMTCSMGAIQGASGFGVYAASKAAVRSFARSWTSDLKARKIRVNVISPGPTETPGLAGLAPDEEHRRGVYGMLVSKVPLGRMGEPDEIAKAALFLASDDSSFVTGIDLFVDGGTAQV
jgi:NAD(P)-dependent dehydrogenase (short-subunit alcohol dehydrogenase family)